MFKPHFYFHNEHWAIIEKPSGVLSVPSRWGREDARAVLGLDLQKFLQTKVYPVHRLDFEVSGLMLWALTPEAQVLAHRWLEKRRMKKTYRGLSGPQNFSHWPQKDGKPLAGVLTENWEPRPRGPVLWKGKMIRGKKRAYISPQGEDTETWAQLLEISSDQNCWKWQLSPVTGKGHQLRLEMSRRGFPLWGDVLYGSKIPGPLHAVALRAVELNFQLISEEERKGLPDRIRVEERINGFE